MENATITKRLGSDVRLTTICEEYEVAELALFGSVLTPEFDDASDVDIAVVFRRKGPSGSFLRFMGLKDALERFFGRSVDLVVADRVRNPVFAEELRSTQQVVYAA